MCVMLFGETDEPCKGVPDWYEDLIDVRPAATADARLSRPPRQVPKLGLQLDSLLPD
jgi:hypothetical protein